MPTNEEPTSRCCAYCYHYGYFIGAPKGVLTCELTGKEKKRPHNYTNCRDFGYADTVTGAKVIEDADQR